APSGVCVALQVYVRFASPSSSAPRTLSAVLVPVMVEGVADAGVATVGAVLPMITVALPLTVPLVAVIVYVPAVEPAVNDPSLAMLPAPVPADHEKLGWL